LTNLEKELLGWRKGGEKISYENSKLNKIIEKNREI
jgi:hypothetical protein